MTSHYIQTLGVAKCREILKGAPDKTAFYDIENNKNFLIEDSSIAMIFMPNRFLIMDNLRAELSAHDTDSCTDIRNHISPNTVVVG